MFSWIKKQPNKGGTPTAHADVAVQQLYPPTDPGLPVRDVDYLLDGNQQMIQRLKLHAASDLFEKRFLEPVRRVAEHVGALPATASDLYSGEGGLLRACVELAFLSFQGSDGRIFTAGATVEVRHKLEPRWRYVCFAAGLLYPLGKPVSALTVSSRTGETWPKHQMALLAWARARKLDRLYVSWANARAEGNDSIGPSPYSSSLVQSIIGAENLDWLEQGAPDLARALYEIVSGAQTQPSIAAQLIQGMWDKARERERGRLPQNYGRVTVGSNLTPYLVGAMRALIAAEKWKINTPPLMVDSAGVFIVWPMAAGDILAQAANEGVSGLPSSPEVLAELLKSGGVFKLAGSSDLGVVEVVDEEGELISAYQIANPLTLLPEYDAAEYVRRPPKTLDGVLKADPLVPAERAAAERVAAAPQKAAEPAPVVPGAPADQPVTAPESSAAVTQATPAKPHASPAPVAASEPPPRRGGAVDAMIAAKSALFRIVEDEEDEDGEDGGAPQEPVSVSESPAQGEPPSDPSPAATPAAQERGGAGAAAPARPQGKPRQTPESRSKAPAAAEAKVEENAPDVRYSDLVPVELRKEIRNPLSVELLGKVVKAWRERGPGSTTMRMTDNGAAIAYEYLATLMRRPPDWINEMAEAGLIYTPPATPGRKVVDVSIPEGTKAKGAVVISSFGCRKLGL